MLLATDLAVLDHSDGSVLLVANAVNYDDTDDRVDEAYADAVARLDAMTAELAAAGAEHGRGARRRREPRPSMQPSRRERATQECRRRRPRRPIRAGEVFQVVLSPALRRSTARPTPLDVYRVLRTINPSPYMYLLRLPGRGRPATSTSSAPARRRWSRSRGGRAITHPIAGTRPRGATPERGRRAAAEDLLADQKERAEHVMLVDLARNDLRRVCEPARSRSSSSWRSSATATSCTSSRPSSGDLARRAGRAYDVLQATFPAGTLSGAPKPRAMELIDELEPVRRGLYGGVRRLPRLRRRPGHGDRDPHRAASATGSRYVQAGGRDRRRLGARQRGHRVPEQGGRGAPGGRRRHQPASAAAMTRLLRGRWPVVLLALAAAALVLLASGRVWAEGTVDGLTGVVRVSVTGRDAQPVLPALALLAGAAAAVLAIGGPVVRRLAAAALLLAGVAAVAAAVTRVGGGGSAGGQPGAGGGPRVRGGRGRPARGGRLGLALGGHRRGSAARPRGAGRAAGRPVLGGRGTSLPQAGPGRRGARPGAGRRLGRAQPRRGPDRGSAGPLTTHGDPGCHNRSPRKGAS